MSGVKYSEIQLAQERQAQQDAQRRINQTDVQIQTLRERLDNLLSALPQGIKSAFASEVKPINTWLQQIPAKVDNGLNSTALVQLAVERETHLQQGKQHLQTAVDIKEQRRDQQARNLLQLWEQINNDCTALAEPGQHWRLSQWQAIQNALSELPDAIDRGDFLPVQAKLDSQQKNLHQLEQTLSSLQQQDEQRRIVLDALRAVCKDMGWEEDSEPLLENPDNPESAIRLTVQTWSAGLMNFTLSLEGIQIDSPISREGRHCHTEFAKVSEKLKGFGVLTQFRSLEQADDEPELIAKGELDIPDEGESLYQEKH